MNGEKDTALFIEALIKDINSAEFPAVFYYERAADDAALPYGVISGIAPVELSTGDLTNFDIDLWGDDNIPGAVEEIELLCDSLRNYIHGRILSIDGSFMGHMSYERRDPSDDKEYDIIHRRLIFSARIFYL